MVKKKKITTGWKKKKHWNKENNDEMSSCMQERWTIMEVGQQGEISNDDGGMRRQWAGEKKRNGVGVGIL